MKKYIYLFFLCIVTLNASSQINTFPYAQDWESGTGGWTASTTSSGLVAPCASVASVWELGNPISKWGLAAHSGANAWTTNLNGVYSNNTRYYLTSPQFDLSSTNKPILAFWMAYQIEYGWDEAIVEYSTDNLNWYKLGNYTSPDWYSTYYTGQGVTSGYSWTGTYYAFKKYFIDISNLKFSNVHFRIVLRTDWCLQYNGLLVDDFSIYEETRVVTNALPKNSFCQNNSLSVAFTATGTYNFGNTFTAQLSDASGSFVSPVNVGNISSTTSGTINATIPANTAYGTSYRIRVVSGDPVITGSDNGTDITINSLPTATITPNGPTTFCPGGSVTLTSSPASSYLWSTGETTSSVVVNTSGNYTVAIKSAANCSATAATQVTVDDNTPPTVHTQNITVQLGASGNASVTAADINDGSTDNCSIPTDGYSLSKTTFDCSNVGANTVTLTVTDVNGNSETGTATVTVEDNVKPTVHTQNVTMQLDASGNASVTAADINSTSTDNCSIPNNGYTLDITSFDCSNVGATTVRLTVTDVNGNSEMGTATVTVEDNVKPTVHTQNVTVQLDASGNATVTAADINNGSTDNCSIPSNGYSLNKTSFDCSNVGANTVTLTVTDVNGNSETGTATVTVEDNVKPTVHTQNVTIQLDASGNASVTAADINSASTDNCSIPNNGYSLDKTSFDCSYVGANTVTLTVTDVNGNFETATATVTVEDNVKPIVHTQNVTIQLDAFGNASVTAAQVNNGSTDNCSIPSNGYSLNKTSFDCSNVGANTVTLTVTDANGNSETGTATVTVEDNVKPTVHTQNVTVQLDAAGNARVTPAQVNNGSTDNCSIPSNGYSIDKTTFDCSNVGANTVTLTVTDVNGNSETGTATVTVEDNVNPTVPTQNVTVQLDASGNASVTAAQVNNGSTDNCSIPANGYSLDKTTFDCSNVGANTVTLTVTDVNGNSETGTATVTVEDKVNPMAKCQNISVYLGQNGTVTISPQQVDNGSTDACGVSLSLDKTTFNSSDIGSNTVTLTVTDPSGNSSNCTSTVTINKRPTTLLYTGDNSEQYSDQQLLTAVLKDQLTNTVLSGKTVGFSIGTQSASGLTNANGIASTNLILTQDPASIYTVSSSFAGDAIYSTASDSDPFDITQEDARAYYSGALFASTSGATSSAATVTLSATIRDITAETADPAYDAFAGDIRNATITFINRDNNTIIASNVPIGLVNSSDLKTGTATYQWNVNIGNSNSQTYTIGVIVNNYYTRNTSDDNSVITVSKHLDDFITGGGYVVLQSSAGLKAGGTGTKNNFGFNVKYNKSGKNLQGNINTIIRRMESNVLKVYQIKGNAMTSLSVNAAISSRHPYPTATFNGKANITDITNPLVPVSVDGNATLQVTMTDAGEPGSSDKIGITVWNKSGGLWFASNWTGTKTIEQLLAGGNLVARNGGIALTTKSETLPPAEVKDVQFNIKAYPNPTTASFRLIVESNSDEPIQINILDVAGRTLKTLNSVHRNTIVITGKELRGGTYFAEALQGSDRKTIRLIKLN